MFFHVHIPALIFVFVIASNPTAGIAQVENDDSILALVEQLGSPSFATREEASHKLWMLSRTAEPIIAVALRKTTNPEIALRCRKVLGKFRLGIYPDTPSDVVEMLKDFADGNFETKSKIVRRLRAKKAYREAIRLVETITDVDLQRAIGRELVDTIGKLIPAVIANGSNEVAEELLAWTTKYDADGTSIRDYAVFLHLQQRHSIDEINSNELLRNNPHRPLIVASVLALAGNLDEARALIDSSGHETIRQRLLTDIDFRQQNWKSVAERFEAPSDNEICRQGFLAAFNWLAGNQQLFARAIDEARQIVIQAPEKTPQCTILFMINDQWEPAIEFNRISDFPQAFELLCYQSRFDDAFKLLKLDDPTTGASSWYTSKLESDQVMNVSNAESERTFTAGNLLAIQLARLGEKEQARLLLLEIAKSTPIGDDSRNATLIQTCRKSGWESIAFDVANARIENLTNHGRRFNVIKHFAADRAGLASDILETLRPQEDDETPENSDLNASGLVQRVKKLTVPSEQERKSLDELKKLATKIESFFIKLDSNKRQRSVVYRNIAELFVQHGQIPTAIEYFKKSQAQVSNSETLLRLGDCYALEQDWQAAAIYFGEAVQAAHIPESIGFVAVAMYLEGHALVKSGNLNEGERQMQAAVLVPLADQEARYELANSLNQRGFHDEAKRFFVQGTQLTLVDMGSYWHHRLTQHAASELSKADPTTASILRERSLLHLLGTETHFHDFTAYPFQISKLHFERAQGLENQGDLTAAVDEWKLCLAAGDTGSEPMVRLVTLLEKLDRLGESNRVFNAGLEKLLNVTDRFENAAEHHNSLAWLCARCNRELVLALEHAQKAVELNPNEATYADTLAEAYFRNDELEKAIEYAERAVELAPNNRGFKDRLNVFKEHNQ